MFKQNMVRRIMSLVLAVMMLVSMTVPSFAMGFDDLQNVVDVTGNSASESAETDSDDLDPGTAFAPDEESPGENDPGQEEDKPEQEDGSSEGFGRSKRF